MHSGKPKYGDYIRATHSMGPNLMDNSLQQSFSDQGVQSGGQYDFTVKNNLYQMQSRCNDLQYDKYKKIVVYNEALSDLKARNIELQELAQSLTKQRSDILQDNDRLKTLLWEVREENYRFSKEIGQLKIKLSSMFSKSISMSISGSGGDPGQLDQVLNSVREELVKKDQMIVSLQGEMMLTSQGSNEVKIAQLEAEKQKIKQQLASALQRQKQLAAEVAQLSKTIKVKQGQQRQDRNSLQAQMEQLRSQNQNKDRRNQTAISEELKRAKQLMSEKQEQIRNLQGDRINLQSKVGELSVEVSRLKCQKSNLQQYNVYLEATSQQSQSKRKLLQEEVFKLQKEGSDLRAQIFNQKLESKKQLNNLRLQFQEERIKHIQFAQEKSKEINILREQSLSSNRAAVDIHEISSKAKVMSDLERAHQQITQLQSQNEGLRKDVKSLESKLQKKHDKYCSLQTKLRGENDQRIKSLQTQLYKQQETIGELQVRLELAQRANKPTESFINGQVNNNKMAVLKQQIKLKDERIKQHERNQRQLLQKKRLQQEIIIKLEGQIRMQREMNVSGDRQERIGTIQLLQQEIVRLNQQIRSQRVSLQQQRKEAYAREQKLIKQIQNLQNFKKKQSSEKNIISQHLSQLQAQLKQRDGQMGYLRQEMKRIKQQKTKNEALLNTQAEQIKNTLAKNEGNLRSEHKSMIEQIQKSASQQISKATNLMKQFEKQNLHLKEEYSQALQQIHALLIKYQSLEQKCKRYQQKQYQKTNEIQTNNTRTQQLEHQCQRLRVALQQQQNEINRLNHIIWQAKYQQPKINNEPKVQYQGKNHYMDKSYQQIKQRPTNSKHQREKSLKRMTERLWLIKDYKNHQRDVAQSHGNFYKPHYHRI